jgi:hypothetical protein
MQTQTAQRRWMGVFNHAYRQAQASGKDAEACAASGFASAEGVVARLAEQAHMNEMVAAFNTTGTPASSTVTFSNPLTAPAGAPPPPAGSPPLATVKTGGEGEVWVPDDDPEELLKTAKAWLLVRGLSDTARAFWQGKQREAQDLLLNRTNMSAAVREPTALPFSAQNARDRARQAAADARALASSPVRTPAERAALEQEAVVADLTAAEFASMIGTADDTLTGRGLALPADVHANLAARGSSPEEVQRLVSVTGMGDGLLRKIPSIRPSSGLDPDQRRRPMSDPRRDEAAFARATQGKSLTEHAAWVARVHQSVRDAGAGARPPGTVGPAELERLIGRGDLGRTVQRAG